MLTWETTLRVINEENPNIMLVGLIINEIELAIEGLKETREENGGLTPVEEELLRSLYVKRFLLNKKFKSVLHKTDKRL